MPRIVALLIASLLCAPVAGANPGSDHMTPPGQAPEVPEIVDPVLRVMTLNVAHGRSTRFNQLLLSRRAVERNIAEVSALIERHAPDVVALQEADGPSRWSGRFDHVLAMAEGARFPWSFRGDHAEGWLYRYGTALLSRLPLHTTSSHRFEPTPPTPTKGFVMGAVRWSDPEAGGHPDIGVVSVHFDYLSSSARQRQYEELAETLAARRGPVVVLGDFNSTWDSPDSPVRRLAERLELRTWHSSGDSLATHAGERIDWILVSRELDIGHYAVLPDRVSDHLAVIAEITRRRTAI